MSFQDESARATERASAVKENARQEATNVAAETRDQAARVGNELRSQVTSKVTEEQHRFAASLHDVGTELESMAQSGDRQDGVAHELSRQLAQRMHNAGSWLDSHEPGDLLDEVSSFARRRPGAFLLGALALGVFAGRMTRSVAAAQRGAGLQTGTSPRPLAERPETAAAIPGQPTGRREPMEPIPGVDEGARARHVADPAARFPDQTEPRRNVDVDEVMEPGEGPRRG